MGIKTGERRNKILLAVAGFVLLMSPALYAFSVTPTRVELSLSPGSTHEGYYEISNKGGRKAIRLSIETKDWVMDNRGGVTMSDAAKTRDFSSMDLVFSPQEVVIPPEKTVKIKYNIYLPKGCSGEFKKYLMFKCTSLRKDKGDIGVATQLSFPFYVIIKGTEVIKYEVGDIDIKSAAPVDIEVSLKNLGNIHVRPTGEITINKARVKAPLLKMPVNTPRPGWPVLPGQDFKFSLRDEMYLDPGDYILRADFDEQGIKASKEVRFKIDSNEAIKISSK